MTHRKDTCSLCGATKDARAAFCFACYQAGRVPLISTCPDCGRQVSEAGRRCCSCSAKRRTKRPPTIAEKLGMAPPNPSGLCMCGCGQPTKIATETIPRIGDVRGHPRQYLQGHRIRLTVPYVEEDRGYKTPCWIWQGKLNHGYGPYGEYEAKVNGPLPPGLVRDHLCRQRDCIRPDHIERVPQAVNVQRGRLASATEEQVRAIRSYPPSVSGKQIAHDLGLSAEIVRCIRRGETWKNIH